MTVYRQNIRVIINLGTRWTIVAIFKPLHLTPGKELTFHIRRLGGIQTRSGYCREENTGNRTLVRPSQRLVTILTTLSRLNNDLKGALKHFV